MNPEFTWISLVLYWIVSALALALTAAIVPGFKVRGFATALIAVIIIGLANRFVWPVLFILTLPINILTLGLFTFVVSAMVLRLCAAFMNDFEITSWFSAIFGGIIFSIASSLLHYLIV